jgi:hypothetical protein
MRPLSPETFWVCTLRQFPELIVNRKIKRRGKDRCNLQERGFELPSLSPNAPSATIK